MKIELGLDEFKTRDQEGFCDTHLTEIEVYSRTEDSSQGTHTTINVQTGNVSQDNDMRGNPSERRTGVVLHFHNEDGTVSSLTIAQHKGIELFESIPCHRIQTEDEQRQGY